MPKSKAAKLVNLKENERKWGRKLWASGWVAIPTVIVRHQKKLQLDGVDLALVMQLLSYWWNHDSHPFPAMATLADSLGVHRSTVQRRLAALKQKGYVEPKGRHSTEHGGQTSNSYDLSGLAMAAESLAEEELAERELRAAKRGAKTKPQLGVAG